MQLSLYCKNVWSIQSCLRILLLQVFLLCLDVQSHRQVWDLSRRSQVVQLFSSQMDMNLAGTLDTWPMWHSTRVWGKITQEKQPPYELSNSLDRSVHKKVPQKTTFFLAHSRRSRRPVQSLQRGLPHVRILSFTIQSSCKEMKKVKNQRDRMLLNILCIFCWVLLKARVIASCMFFDRLWLLHWKIIFTIKYWVHSLFTHDGHMPRMIETWGTDSW